MRILFTGGSSFTGAWMVPALAQAGHEVTAVFTRGGPGAYDGLRRQRVERVRSCAQAVWGMESGDEAFVRLCREHGPWDLLCLHGAEVGDYRSADFDWRRALARNTRGFGEMLAAFSAGGGRGVVLTGTYFEADEGNPDGPTEAFSAYGLAKTLTWQVCRYECLRAGLSLGKFVIPNPVGPLEEPKLVASLARAWREGRTPSLHTPLSVGDNVPVTWLAAEYADFVQAVRSAGVGAAVFRRPGGWVESVAAFGQRVAQEFGRLSGASFAVTVAPQGPQPAGPGRRNPPRGPRFLSPEAESRFWREWHGFYFPPTDVGPVFPESCAVRSPGP